MRHSSEAFFVPLKLEDYEGHDYARLQRRIARSNRFPLKPFAIMAGLLNGAVLATLAVILRLFGRAQPDLYDRDLGRLYFHVPEMAVHKRIELDAFTTRRNSLLGRCVDLGCGNGFVGGILKRMASIEELHGVDPVESFVNDTIANDYSGFTSATASKIPLESASFDCAISICVMEHVEDLDDALREVLRLLKPGGALVLTTPAPEFRMSAITVRLWSLLGLRERAEVAARLHDKVSMHFHYATADEWRNNLAAIGFDCVDVMPFFSTRQMLAYEIINWPVRIPELYFADKLWVLGSRFRPLKQGLAWSTAVIAAWMASWSVRDGCHTHWLISARRPGIESGLAGGTTH
jgi:SAM-dependent methyltransferase